MKKELFMTALVLLMGLSSCGVRTSQSYYNYDSKIMATRMDGSYTIRAWGRGRNMVVAFKEAKKQAVYDVVFNGLQSDNSKIEALRPLMMETNAKEKYAEYFNTFFADEGEWLNYGTLRDNRTLSEQWSRNRQEVTVQMAVNVDRAALRRKLIEDNILKTE